MSIIQVGQALRGPIKDPLESGEEVASRALRGTTLPVRAVLVFVKSGATSDLESFLRGVSNPIPFVDSVHPPIVFGCTTPFPIAREADADRTAAVVTTLAASVDHLTVHVGVGESVSVDPEAAVDQALETGNIRALLRERRDGFLFVISPGPPSNSSTPEVEILDERILRRLAEKVGARVTIFGGSCAADARGTSPLQFVDCRVAVDGFNAGRIVAADRLIVAFIETAFARGSACDTGISTWDNALRIESLAGSATIANRVARVAGRTAQETLAGLTRGRRNSEPVIAVGDPLTGYRMVRATALPGPEGVVALPRGVSCFATWVGVATNETELRTSSKNVTGEALQRGGPVGKGLALMIADVHRGALVGMRPPAHSKFDTHAVEAKLPSGMKLAGFYGHSVFRGILGHDDCLYHYAVGIGILGNTLDRAAALEHQLRLMNVIAFEGQFLRTDKDICERMLHLLNEVGYLGGMVSLVEPDRGTGQPQRIRAQWAVDAQGVDCFYWSSILQQTDRPVDCDDVLVEALKAKPTPGYLLIRDSATDPWCNVDAVKKARLQGQLVFPLKHGPDGLGILQIGVPRNYQPVATEIAALQALVDVVGRCIHSLRIAQRQREQEQQLVTISGNAQKAHDLRHLLSILVTTAVMLTDADLASVRTVDHERQLLEFQYYFPTHHPDWSEARRTATFPLTVAPGQELDYIATWVAREKTYFRSSPERPNFCRFFKGCSPEVKGEVSIPLMIAGADGEEELYGIITVNSKRGHFSEEQAHRLLELGRLAAVLLQHAIVRVQSYALMRVSQLFLTGHGIAENSEQRLRRLCEIISDAVGAKACSIFLAQPDAPRRLVLRATTSSLTRHQVNEASYMVGQGLTGGVAKVGRPLRLSRLHQGMNLTEHYPNFAAAGVTWAMRTIEVDEHDIQHQCFLGVPIIWNKDDGAELLGVVRCTGKLVSGRFTESDEKLLVEIAEWLALGLKHAQIVDWERDRWNVYTRHLLGHQLKRPVATAVQQLNQLIKRSPHQDHVPQLQQCRSGLSRLNALLDGLSVLGQTRDIRSTKANRDRIQAILEECIETGEAQFAVEFPNRRATKLRLQCPAEDIYVPVYRVFLREALLNLINNALRLTAPSTTVEVTLSTYALSDATPAGSVVVDGTHTQEAATWSDVMQVTDSELASLRRVVVIAVRDRGPGLLAAQIPRIFQPLVQGSTPTSEDGLGLGLGLTIVQATAQAHSGAVAVSSVPRVGSTFMIVLPDQGS